MQVFIVSQDEGPAGMHPPEFVSGSCADAHEYISRMAAEYDCRTDQFAVTTLELDRPPLGNTGCEPLTEMYWSGDTAGPGWEVIERNPAPYYTGMTIRRSETPQEFPSGQNTY